jgi:hypothetical protein
MRSLVRPTYTARYTYELCAKSVRDAAIAKKLKLLAPAVEDAESMYLALSTFFMLFGFVDETIGEKSRSDEMIRLYTDILSRKGSKARHIYDQIRSAPKGDICPLCGQRLVSTLDHYLEKARFPVLAVAPLNLVPSCADCNIVRAQQKAKCPSDQTLHPYFDNVDDQVWLVASVCELEPVAVKFVVIKPDSWDEMKFQRIRSHFRVFALGTLYSTHAAAEMAGIRYALESVFHRGGPEGLQSHLAEQALSRSQTHRNSWQGALYTALRDSGWFCSGGFRSIPS